MPLKPKELPLEVYDHVVLDTSISVGTLDNRAHLIVPAGRHGIVRVVSNKGDVVRVDFGGNEYVLVNPATQLTLYRRSLYSKRRT